MNPYRCLRPALAAITALVPALAIATPITYVDAVSGSGGNTFATGSTQTDTSWVAPSGPQALNNQWRLRTDVEGNGNTIFQAIPQNINDNPPPFPELTTTLGLADGRYEVWVFFWTNITNPTQNWVISTGLTSGSLVTYHASSEPDVPGATKAGVTSAADLTFEDAVQVVSGDGFRRMFGVNLGEVDVTGGSLNVYVDMLVPGSTTTQRVWYDGVGYAPVAASPPLAITSFSAIEGDVWEVALQGAPDTTYQFRSAPDLAFDSGTLVEGLTQGDPDDAGAITGAASNRLTTDADGIGVVRMTLTGSANFVRAETLPPILSADFEVDGAGFTATGTPNDWVWGLPASNNDFDLDLQAANGGSGGAWGTNLGDGSSPSGLIDPAADSALRSPDLDLTGISGAQLEFAAAYDIAVGDTVEIRIRDAGTDAVLATIFPLTAPATSGWTNLGPFDLSAADDSVVYLEFFYKGASNQFLGWYIDDVLVRD